ncbi:threonine-phosphate decarboxylase CobD [Pseudooceanicola algae]|uniref:threonine-phosphate decarboxylase n=1 Tax=Pseudooceanicola algae TaxID=1537215 RepID=A0A418SKL6_9RHOB|nr:threonine-phosphate decarboxylase CobD [Pseudooceanicola algae]QPM91037.1 Histidinol-phosphate aminotransferase [Pseudooceanicola algae]
MTSRPKADGPRDHGGNLDAAIARFGGAREDWLDLSTGINPVPYPLPDFPAGSWTALPDHTAQDALLKAARRFWSLPSEAAILAVPGASAAIAHLPLLAPSGTVHIPAPTYNEHAASFARCGWQISAQDRPDATARVLVHPNNPTGAFHDLPGAGPLTVIDESFCDIAPDRSLVDHATHPNTLILKSFGKFWGLAGLRLGFVIAAPDMIARLADMLGPWPVSGPALEVGRRALSDPDWAEATRARLTRDAARMDAILAAAGATIHGGTPLFRLYDCDDPEALQTHLASHWIWSRTFPYSGRWIRLGLPPEPGFARLEQAMA